MRCDVLWCLSSSRSFACALFCPFILHVVCVCIMRCAFECNKWFTKARLTMLSSEFIQFFVSFSSYPFFVFASLCFALMQLPNPLCCVCVYVPSFFHSLSIFLSRSRFLCTLSPSLSLSLALFPSFLFRLILLYPENNFFLQRAHESCINVYVCVCIEVTEALHHDALTNTFRVQKYKISAHNRFFPF